MLIGLSSKNAILIVEFAKVEYDKGKSLIDATLTGAGEIASNPDDFICLYPWLRAVVAGIRSWRDFAAGAGNDGHRRHARIHGHRDFLCPGFL